MRRKVPAPRPPGRPATLVRGLLDAAAADPARQVYTFLRDGETEQEVLTRGALERAARDVAARLRESGCAPGDRALLLFPPGLDFVKAFFGCLYAGVIAVPAYPPAAGQKMARLMAVVADAGAVAALTTRPVRDGLGDLAGVFDGRVLLAEEEGGAGNGFVPVEPSPGDLALLQYTSGSTGDPKGVMISHANLLHNIFDGIAPLWQGADGDGTADAMVTWLPMFHDMGLVFGTLTPLLLGVQCRVMSPAAFLHRPLRWLRAISRFRATLTAAPDFAFDLCARRATPEDLDALDLSCLRVAFNGAEPVRASTLDRFTAVFAPCGFRRQALCPAYGLAEATLAVAAVRAGEEAEVLRAAAGDLERHRVRSAGADEAARELVGCGSVVAGTRVRIVDPGTGESRGPEEVGEIWAAGPGVARGYWRRPEETGHTFGARIAGTGEGPFLRTGDLGFLSGGRLFVAGRCKDVMIFHGRNVYPQDVEITVERSHPALRPAGGAAFSVEVEGVERLVVVHEVERRGQGEVEGVLGGLREAVAREHGIAVHRAVLLRPGRLPRTSSGKVQRGLCRRLLAEGGLAVVAERVFRLAGEGVGGAPEAPAGSGEEWRAWLHALVARHLGVAADEISDTEPLGRYGLSSVAAARVAGDLAERLGRPVSPTELYDHPTVAALAAHLAPASDAVDSARVSGTTPAPRPARRAEDEPVAVIGLAFRFPGADGPEALWDLLRHGRCAVGEVPAERRGGVPAEVEPAVLRAGLLSGIDLFDAAFFGISPREAACMDPQQRLLLETAWHALEDAGLPPAELAGKPAGVFLGISAADHLRLALAAGGEDPYLGAGGALGIAANRISYALDLQGPSLAVDTACSSSLVAVHLACQSLRQGECDLALAGGVHLILQVDSSRLFARAGMLSPRGRCRTFDADAEGYVRGEGGGLAVLKRLSDARRDGDRILAVVRGSAVNQDGRSAGLTAPNGPAQQRLVRAALRAAGVRPAEVGYVEAHGTGTPLGDPIEANALAAVLAEGRGPDEVCQVGSVKANLGHLEPAAGIAGFCAAVLALSHREIPGNAGLRRLNPEIRTGGSPLRFPAVPVPWSVPPGRRRIAGVSSFGFGGTNAHVVLEEAPDEAPAVETEDGRTAWLLPLSARSQGALEELGRRYAALLRSGGAGLAEVCDAAALGRSALPLRAAVVAASREEAVAELERLTLRGEALEREPRRELPVASAADETGPRPVDWRTFLESLGASWVRGAAVDWRAVSRGARRGRVSLPFYPFERRSFCLQESPSMSQRSQMPSVPHPDLLPELTSMVAEALQARPDEVSPDIPFLEMGADSLAVVQVVRRIERAYQVRLTVRQLFSDLPTLRHLAAHLAAQVPAAEPAGAEVMALPLPTPPETPREGMERLLLRQLDILRETMADQLRLLGGNGGAPAVAAPAPRRESAPSAAPPEAPKGAGAPPPPVSLPPWRVAEVRPRSLTEAQQAHLDRLTERYTRRTAASRRYAERYRPRLADNRASAGFRFSTKEMLYPIVGAGSSGARFRDLDGNEYIDISMGFGVGLFGHQPPFVAAALREQLDRGIEIGPQPALAGEVAELLCRLTGFDRAAFCNTGTEAVMTALRLVRAVTGRRKVAVFAGAYHGHFDGLLGEPAEGGAAEPMAPGVMPGMVEDLLVLPFDDPAALETIRARAGELAAVLVEPVQSRRPALQPAAFLRRLRELTREVGVPLIFDEMITGFRLAVGGAQAWFGIEADLATYGKIVGGGLPIGVVAGRSAFLDALDGGPWRYGDGSYPAAETTFFAGTFCKHPLALAAARAVLGRLEAGGAEEIAGLNERTARFAAGLNAWLAAREAPLRIDVCGSLFRFAVSGNLDLFFFHLLDRGIYIWEGRNCFFSMAHGDEEIARVAAAVRDSLEEMAAGGFVTLRDPGPPRPGEGEAAAPASDAQRQLWLLAQLEPEGSRAYHVAAALRLRGPLDPAALRAAADALVARHEALRTVFGPDGREQRILPPGAADLTWEEEAPGDLREWLRAAAAQPFDLQQGPVFRLRGARIAPEEHALLLSVHHIVADGWSVGLLADELGQLYSALREGRASALPEPMQLREYVRLCAAAAEFPEMAAHEAWWLARLADPPEPLDLPFDRPRGGARSFAGERRHGVLPGEPAERLRAFGRTQRATPFMTLLAVCLLVLHRLTRQSDLAVGLPVAGRPFEGSEGVVGYCAHVMPFRCRVEPGLSFAGVVERVRDELLHAYEHQDYPLARMVERLRRPGVDPLRFLGTLFNVNPLSGLPRMAGLEVERLAVPVSATPFELFFDITALDRGMAIDCDYRTALLDAATVDLCLGLFRHLLDEALAAPEAMIADLPLLGAAERREVLDGFNAAALEAPVLEIRGLHTLFEGQAAVTPEAPALACAGRVLTYAELEARSNRLAHHLIRRGVGPGDLVGICMGRSADLVVALLAVLKAGAAYLPMDPAYPAERLAFMAADAGLSTVLADAALASEVGVAGAGVLRLDQIGGEVDAELSTPPEVTVSPESLAYVLYTSGSTGRPKGVAVAHRGACVLIAWAARIYGRDELAGVLATTSICFDLSVFELFAPLGLGGRVLLAESALHAATLPEAEEATLLNAVPSAVEGLVRAGRLPPRLQVVNLAGETPGRRLLEDLQAAGVGRVFNLYGPTEDTVYSTWAALVRGDAGPVPIGRAVDHTRVYVVDAGLQPVPPGLPGELCLGGAGLARGYLHRPELTAERFVPDPFAEEPGSRLFRTRDRARFLADGRLFFLGRMDRQLKLRGYRLEPGEIERVLEEHPAVARAAVVVQPRSGGGALLVAFAQLRAEIDARELRAHLAGRLPAWSVPAHLETVDALPLTPNGKIDREALAGRRVEPRDDARPGLAPRTETEREVAALWQGLLERPVASVDVNFFDVGGDSLLLLQLHRLLRERFALDGTVVDLFRHPTVEAQARLVAAGEGPTGSILARARERALRRLEALPAGTEGEARNGR